MRPLLPLFLLAALAAHTAFATDRVVSASGTYNTISSAIAASSDGDRILVQPGTYTEDVFISKSLTLLANQEGGRYALNGALALMNASGKSILLSGIRILRGLSTIGTNTARTEFRMVDSFASYCSLSDPFLRVELYRDTIASSVFMSSGVVVGNQLPGTSNSSAGVALNGASSLPDENFIIGNAIGYAFNGFGVSIASDAVFHVENNFIQVFSGSPGLPIDRSQAPTTSICTILNNTFYKINGSATVAVNNPNFSHFNLLLKNNAVVGFTSGVVSSDNTWTQLVQSNNQAAASSSINTSTGQPVNGSPLINAGDPDPRYLDLDLTTNDVGCYGGSNSRANFITPMGSAVVGFMNAPRVVSQGDAVSISATGFDR